MESVPDNRIPEQQLELLKSFKYLTNDQQISEVKELLSLYYEYKLQAAIDKEEAGRNYTSEVYQSWLTRQRQQTTVIFL